MQGGGGPRFLPFACLSGVPIASLAEQLCCGGFSWRLRNELKFRYQENSWRAWLGFVPCVPSRLPGSPQVLQMGLRPLAARGKSAGRRFGAARKIVRLRLIKFAWLETGPPGARNRRRNLCCMKNYAPHHKRSAGPQRSDLEFWSPQPAFRKKSGRLGREALVSPAHEGCLFPPTNHRQPHRGGRHRGRREPPGQAVGPTG